MKLLAIFALILFCQSVAFAQGARRQNDVISVDEVQNKLIEELKKQIDDMKAVMEEQTLKFEKKLALQEETFQEEISSLKTIITAEFNDVTDIVENTIVAENGRKIVLAFYSN